MRTMLISFILICSLAQLASAEDPISTQFHPEECGDGFIYKCYAPVTCIGQESADVNNINQGGILEVAKDTKIASDCPALIKFHSYGPHWVYVAIESFQESSIVNSIEFKQYEEPDEKKGTFTCSVEDGKLIGKYGTTVNDDKLDANGNPMKDSNGIILKEKRFVEFSKFTRDKIVDTEKINCFFEVRRRTVEQFTIFPNRDDIQNFYVQFIVNKNLPPTQKTPSPDLYLMRCDPGTLEFNDVEDKEKIYEKAEYDLMKKAPYCKNSKSKIEFRKEGTTKFDGIDQFKCNGNMFNIKGVSASEPIADNNGVVPAAYKFAHNEDIDIRCVSEVRFGCNYAVKTSGNGSPPVLTPPDYIAQKTELKCPGEKPHLIIEEGGEDPIFYAKFECLKYGKTATQWTVVGRKGAITKEGPAVNCTDTVDCKYFFTFSESAITEGFVSTNDYMPRCFDSGTMWVGGDKTAKIRCDGKDGKYKYTVGGEEKVVDKDTKFVCKYPPVGKEEAERKNEENRSKLTTGMTVTIGVAVFLLAVTIPGCIIATMIQKKKNRAAVVALTNAEQMHFGTKSEKQKARIIDRRAKGLNSRSSSHDSDNAKNGNALDNYNNLTKYCQRSFQASAKASEAKTRVKIARSLEGRNHALYAVHKAYKGPTVAVDKWNNETDEIMEIAANYAKTGVATGLETRRKSVLAAEERKKQQ